ncbi:PAN domain-containing protein [Maricaulis sp.]|uniref:PAN domain-containing protein n=1 Tax=Maricaulis sp. TaxID=1486257 RepID=UPI0026270446|nr:PAN domain-containing protein [Maricaulis sp.]
MRHVLSLIAAIAACSTPAIAQGGEGHARRGAIYDRVDMDAGTVQACSALCDRDDRCAAWSYARAGLMGPYPQCALLSAPTTPIAQPGHTTGLSTALADRVASAAQRPLSERELVALRATYSRYPH